MSDSVAALRHLLQRLLSGETTYLESAPLISRLRFAFDAEDDPDFLSFVLIDSETDHLPIGPQRQYWTEEALARKQADMQRAEAWARSFGEASAWKLFERYCGPSSTAG